MKTPIDLTKPPVIAGDIVQLSPEACANKMFGACLMVVTEVRQWGCVGYVQSLGKYGSIGGQAYYRAVWAEIEPTGGQAEFLIPQP